MPVTTRLLMKTEEGGFTLIEVLIAVMVFAIGTLAIATMQGTAIRGNSMGRHSTEATTLAMTWLEDLASLPYTDARLQDTTLDGVAGLDNGIDAKDGVTPDFPKTVDGNYTVFWNVADDQFISQTRTLALYVTWQDHQDMTRSVRMGYILPQRF